MNIPKNLFLQFNTLFLLGAALVRTAAAETTTISLRPNLSLKNEIQHAIDLSIGWLSTQQDTNGGYWSSPDYPALTALVLTGCMGEPSGAVRNHPPEFIKRGYEYLVGCAQPDGGIYKTNLANYNTSLAIMALLAARDSKYEKTLLRARNFVVGQQNDMGEKGKMDTSVDGGIGYGSRGHSDMSNTLMALEAIYYSKFLAEKHRETAASAEMQELNWTAVVEFIQRCQNLPSHNKEAWVSDDAQNKGGFVYYPGYSMAGEMTLPSGRTALRSYGSISYAGLLSYVYANLKRDDPRVLAVYDWLKKNYTLEENPGMGEQGLYYYFMTMSKALSTYGVDRLELKDGKTILWREELAKRLLNLQNSKGFWMNENNRWWEKDPVLVTAYTMIALEYIALGL